MKRLYVVTLSMEVVVVAEGPSEASRIAEVADIDFHSWDGDAVEMRHLPGDWDLDCIPFGDADPERTVGQWIEAGAAPAYVDPTKKLVSPLEDPDDQESL